MTRRYIVQRAASREILTREAQLTTDDQKHELSAAGSCTFVTSPVIAEQLAADGLPMFGKWRTLIAEEEDGQIRWRGIVTDVDTEGATRTITVDTMSTYPHGIAYLGPAYYGAEVDPADVIRMIWAHVQSYDVPASDLGVTVVGSTPIRIGTYSTQNKDDTIAAYNDAVAAYDAALADRRAAQAAESAARDVYSTRVASVTSASAALRQAKAGGSSTAIAAAQAAYDDAIAARDAQGATVDQLTAAKKAKADIVDQREVDKSTTYTAKVAASKAVKEDGGAYTLLPWETPDCGQAIDTLASDNGIDWYERHRWNEDRSDIITEIVIDYPRAGSRRTDLVFQQGLNIRNIVPVKDGGDDYANVQVGVGAGEGAGAIRRERPENDGALRRTKVVSAKDVTSPAELDKRLNRAAPASLVTDEIDSIEVVTHPNAPLGAWMVGDDIRIDAYVQARGETVGLWHRITSWTRTSDTRATIALHRSNAYTYGG